MFPNQIFRAYDIRGVYPTELNENLVYKIGRAYGALRQKELSGQEQIKVIVGHDMRLSSPTLFENLIKGLLDQGIDVVDIGLSSTPTFYFAVSYYGLDGGLMISASHNPAQYNGVKLVREKASPVGQGSGMEEVREIAEQEKFGNPARPGVYEKKEDVLIEQVRIEESYADLPKIKPLKIVLDTANSMGILYLEKVFADLPQIEIVKMNAKLDGSFPAHEANPFLWENVKDLATRVLEEKADLGVATDGDGDRIFFIDNKGQMIEPPIVRGIMAQIFLRTNPGAVICYDIRPGKITEEMIINAGGEPSLTKVGHSFIKKQMLETGAVFGGESSGHFMVKFPYGVFEAPIVVLLKFLQEISEKNVTAEELVGPYKKYFNSGEINFKVFDKEKIINCLKEKYRDADVNLLDGLTITYPDFWFNVRASNTEPLLRINLEAVSKEVMEEKVKEVKKVVESCL